MAFANLLAKVWVTFVNYFYHSAMQQKSESHLPQHHLPLLQ